MAYHRLSSIREGRSTGDAGTQRAVERARELFLDERNVYGCAETTFVVLKEAFGLPDSADASPAMALNGGIAYSGATCGAITGAALAVGMLAARRIADHRAAKRAARRITARLMDDFAGQHGALDCRTLLGLDLRSEEQHRAFIAGGIWRERCMGQIEFAVGRLAPLADEATWRRTLREARRPRPAERPEPVPAEPPPAGEHRGLGAAEPPPMAERPEPVPAEPPPKGEPLGPVPAEPPPKGERLEPAAAEPDTLAG